MSTRSGTVLLRELADDEVVGCVNRLHDLVVRDGAAAPERVPAGPANVGRRLRVRGEAPEPLVGLVAAGPAPDAYPGRHAVPGAEEGEDLQPDLRHHVAIPRLVLPRAGLAEAVGEKLVP